MPKVYGMIFAAGLGTRLAPFTNKNPKALVPIGGVPMLERVIKRFVAASVTDIVINVHHFAQKILSFLKENDNFGANIHISDERDCLLDTGGGLLKATDWLSDADAVLVHNADVLSDVNLREMLSTHFETDADVTLLISKRHSSRHLYFNFEMQLVGWKNTRTGEVKPAGFNPKGYEPFSFGGIHVLSREALSLLKNYSKKREKVFSIIPFYIDSCRKLVIKGFNPDPMLYKWFDVGSSEKVAQAEMAVETMNF